MSNPQPTPEDRPCDWYENGCLIGNHGGEPTASDCASCMDYKGASRGAGDRVARLLEIVKLDTLRTKKRAKGGCGCGQRRAALNERFPSRRS